MYSALVIGCGNIGAGYDIDNNQVQTHVKAYHLDPRFSLSIFDIYQAKVTEIASKYNCEIVDSIERNILSTFDCVSICTNTDTHFHLLKMAIEAGVKVILCEKPISNYLDELKEARRTYLKGESKVLVNYFRRFQPAYIELRKFASILMQNEILTNINIRYQRGFVNNCGHALDILEFITGSEINLKEIKKHNFMFDHFKNDPTISLQAIWNSTNICINGLSNVRFSYFEIDLFFEYHKICVKNAGQNIEIFKAENSKQFLKPLSILADLSYENCIENYMVNVIENVHQLLKDKNLKDNFLQSINLNTRMLNYIE